MRAIRPLLQLVLFALFLPLYLATRSRRTTLVWGFEPLLNNKYWSEAMRRQGLDSETLARSEGRISVRADFDLYFDDLVPRWVQPRKLRTLLAPFFAFRRVLQRARVVHLAFSGGPLATTPAWRAEAWLLRRAGVRSVVIPYGADIFRNSEIADPLLRDALVRTYPQSPEDERRVAERVRYWSRHADLILAGFTADGLPRCDARLPNMLCVDVDRWAPRREHSRAVARNKPVTIVHSSNHRLLKGTQFLLDAVAALRDEGLEIELVLLEGVANEHVRSELARADVYADQFVLIGYGLAAIEAMACGLPVLANLEDDELMRELRERSFLGECPIVSTSRATLTANLRALVTDPDLRRELRSAGRLYAEKYHSFAAAQFLFGAVHERLEGREVDLERVFAPQSSPYNRRQPRVEHPLVAHRPVAR